MSSTNKTANYELSQFVGTDIPSILNDYNGDMRKIDTAIKAVATAEGGSASDIAGLQSTVGQHTTEISGLSSTVNSLSGRVIGIEGKIPANASESNKLITAQDIPEIPSVEQLEQDVATLQTNVSDLQEEVSDVSDDVKDIQLCVPANASESNKFATMADVGGGSYTPNYKNVTSEIDILSTDTVKQALDKIHDYLGSSMSRALKTVIKIGTKLFRVESFDHVFIFYNKSFVYNPAEETAPVSSVTSQEDYLFITDGSNLYESKYYRHITNDSTEVGWSDLGSHVETITVYALS